MEEILGHLEKKLTRAKKKLEDCVTKHGEKPNETHTYWGGEIYGYLKGKVTTLEDCIDIIKESPFIQYKVETPLINFDIYLMSKMTADYSYVCVFKVGDEEVVIREEVSLHKVRGENRTVILRNIVKHIFEQVSQHLMKYLLGNYDYKKLNFLN